MKIKIEILPTQLVALAFVLEDDGNTFYLGKQLGTQLGKWLQAAFVLDMAEATLIKELRLYLHVLKIF